MKVYNLHSPMIRKINGAKTLHIIFSCTIGLENLTLETISIFGFWVLKSNEICLTGKADFYKIDVSRLGS
jgi:hypothetical protein